MKVLLRTLCLALTLVWGAIFPADTMAAAGCSIYSNYGGNTGRTWFNEHYYGSTVNHFLEIFSRNPNITASSSNIWSKWYIRIYDKNNTTYTFPLSSKTTACTTSGGRTYITHHPDMKLNFNDAMVVVFDGPPGLSSTQEIDAYVYSNAIPPRPYTYFFGNYYTPTCGDLKDSIDSQVITATILSLFTDTYNGQNVLVMPNFNNKDNSRIPDGTGKWEETSDGGSGTTYTQCVTNDPVDIAKSFTWAPTYTEPTYSGTVDAGAVVTFTVSARNNTKASMVGVKISDTLPNGLTLSGTPTASGGATVSCTGGTCVLTAPPSLPAGATISMTFNAKVTAGPGTTIRNEAVQTGGTNYDPPPMAEAFITVGSGPGAAGSFNACHNYNATDASSCSNGSSGKARLYTRLANSAFTTDIVALKSDGTVFKDFVGASGTARTVKVELIDQANNSVLLTQDVTFPARDTTGHAVASWPALNKAYPKLQVRITDSNPATPVVAVSSDSFAVRPSAVTFTTNASPSASPTPIIKAGTAFTISASTSPATGYDGALVLEMAKLSGSSVRGNLNAAGTSNLLALQANASASNNASYDEVGYLYAAAGAFRDDTFTAIDQNAPAGCNPAADCDCISSATATTANAYLLDGLVDNTGRVGCSIGNKTEIAFGRFIPDHFTVSGVLTNRSNFASCTSTFTYMGEPMRLVLSLTARNVVGGTTQNYDSTSGFARLDGTMASNWNDATHFGTNGSIGLGAVNGTTPLSARLAVSNLSSNWVAGVGTLAANVALARATNPDGAFDSLQLGVAPKDLDGVTLLSSALDLDADLAAPENERQLVATTRVRYGRVRLSNAHGSELLPLSVPLQLEYFKTGAGFVASSDDSCTDFAVSALTLSNPQVNMTLGASTPSFVRTPPSGGVLSAIRLTAPGVGRNGSIDLELDVPAWLEFPWGGGNPNPRARATFGVYRGNNNFIYMRENY